MFIKKYLAVLTKPTVKRPDSTCLSRAAASSASLTVAKMRLA